MSAQCVSSSGYFWKNCQYKFILSELLAIVNMILNGLFVQENCSATQLALTINQLMMFSHHAKMPKCNHALCATINIISFPHFMDDQKTC